MMIEEIPEGYFCQHCGYTSYTCELGDCPNSPAKKHVYIAQKPNGALYLQILRLGARLRHGRPVQHEPRTGSTSSCKTAAGGRGNS